MITGKYISVYDKLRFLWCLCLIEHYNEIGRKVTWHNIEEDFGKEATKMFHFFRDMAIGMKLVRYNSHQLTQEGQLIAARWRNISNRLYNSAAV